VFKIRHYFPVLVICKEHQFNLHSEPAEIVWNDHFCIFIVADRDPLKSELFCHIRIRHDLKSNAELLTH